MLHDLEKVTNMKLVLCIFEPLSGLKINFHKSENFCFGKLRMGNTIIGGYSAVRMVP